MNTNALEDFEPNKRLVKIIFKVTRDLEPEVLCLDMKNSRGYNVRENMPQIPD